MVSREHLGEEAGVNMRSWAFDSWVPWFCLGSRILTRETLKEVNSEYRFLIATSEPLFSS